MFSVQWTGIAEVQHRLDQVTQVAQRVGEDALYAEGVRIWQESQLLVPVDTGRLRATGEVRLPVQEGPNLTVDINYGHDGPLGPAPYAALIEFLPMPHRRGGQWHYLQQPFFQAEQGLAQRVALAMQRGLTTL